MPPDNLREFLQAIDEAGELVRVAQPVRARLEIAEIADRCMKSPGGGPALLFDTPQQPAYYTEFEAYAPLLLARAKPMANLMARSSSARSRVA